MDFLIKFMAENMMSNTLTKNIADAIKSLWEEYKLPNLKLGASILSADFGNLGVITIRRILSFKEQTELKYESGNYDYISIRSDNTREILWTDYSEEQPYNRQGGLYGDGAAFEHFDSCINHQGYREFNMNKNYMKEAGQSGTKGKLISKKRLTK